MKAVIKRSIKSILSHLGYEVHKRINDDRRILDAFTAQKLLLSHTEVRVVFDLGANIGHTVELYKNFFEKAEIYCFEPFEEAFLTLSNTYQRYNKIYLYQLAVSKEQRNYTFFVNKINSTNSLLPISDESHNYVNADLTENILSIQVPSISLDKFCSQNQISRIDILKMDIQGGELMALQGAKNLLSKQAIDLIYTEVLFAKLYENQANFWNICEVLEQYGYLLYGLYDLNYGRNTVLAWGDAIFISSTLQATLNQKIKTSL